MKFYNPFGPYILHSEIDEESRKNSLDLILQLDKGIKNDTIKSEGKIISGDDRISSYEENSISNGTMKRIPLASNSPIGNIICSFTTDYFKQFEILNPFYDDSGSIIKHKDYTNCETHKSLVHSAWYVIMESGDFQILHAHNAPTPHAIMSGAIYLDIPKDIKLPQGNLNFTLNSHDAPLHNAHWSITPKNGDVYVWPAWLKHFVYPFKSKEKRIMISFNSIWKKIDSSV